MYYYTLYDSTTDEIKQRGMCSNKNDLDGQARDGLTVLKGVFVSKQTHKIIRGKPVKKNLGEL